MKPEVAWSKTDAEIACEMGWSIFSASKKRWQYAPEQFKSRGLAGKRVRLTAKMYIELLTINPLADWWEGFCVAEGGGEAVIEIHGRGQSSYLKRDWTPCAK